MLLIQDEVLCRRACARARVHDVDDFFDAVVAVER